MYCAWSIWSGWVFRNLCQLVFGRSGANDVPRWMPGTCIDYDRARCAADHRYLGLLNKPSMKQPRSVLPWIEIFCCIDSQVVISLIWNIRYRMSKFNKLRSPGKQCSDEQCWSFAHAHSLFWYTRSSLNQMCNFPGGKLRASVNHCNVTVKGRFQHLFDRKRLCLYRISL